MISFKVTKQIQSRSLAPRKLNLCYHFLGISRFPFSFILVLIFWTITAVE